MGYQSYSNEMHWICHNAWKLSLGQSMFFVGSVVGTLGLGYLADIVGRLPILILANFIGMLGNLLTILSKNLALFCVFRFIAGLATDANFLMMYILGEWKDLSHKLKYNSMGFCSHGVHASIHAHSGPEHLHRHLLLPGLHGRALDRRARGQLAHLSTGHRAAVGPGAALLLRGAGERPVADLEAEV